MTSKLLVHMPVDGPHGNPEFLRQVRRRLPILVHIPDFPDLVRRQLVVALWTPLEFFHVPQGDQPIPAHFDSGQPFIPNQRKYALRRNAQDFTGLLGGEVIHTQ